MTVTIRLPGGDAALQRASPAPVDRLTSKRSARRHEISKKSG